MHCVLFQEADSDPSGEAAQTTQQTLTFYELDLGLNHVVRKYSEPLEEHGNMLIAGHFLNLNLIQSVAFVRQTSLGSIPLSLLE